MLCLSAIPGVGPSYAPKITNETNQVVLVRAAKKQSSSNKLQSWQRIDGCWVLVKSAKGRNGYAGWVKRPLDGSGKSPIGAFTLTDAGGRLANPGTTLPYHYGPQAYSRFGYKMNLPVQVFDYVVAINYNRFIGHPRATRRVPIEHYAAAAFGSTSTVPERPAAASRSRRPTWRGLRWLTPARSPHHHGPSRNHRQLTPLPVTSPTRTTPAGDSRVADRRDPRQDGPMANHPRAGTLHFTKISPTLRG